MIPEVEEAPEEEAIAVTEAELDQAQEKGAEKTEKVEAKTDAEAQAMIHEHRAELSTVGGVAHEAGAKVVTGKR